MRAVVIIWTAALLLSSAWPEAQGHIRSQSFSKWTASEASLHFVFVVSARRVTQLSRVYPETTLHDLLKQHLTDSIVVSQQVSQQDSRCTLRQLQVPETSGGTMRAQGQFTCPAEVDESTLVTITSFAQVSPTHIHIARTESAHKTREYVLTAEQASFAPRYFGAQTAGQFIRLGFDHVLSGLDHLAFLLALLLLARSTRRTIWCLTGFTIGHSISLALATLHLISPNEYLIEAFIGFTIAVTALAHTENRGRPAFPPVAFAALILVIAAAAFNFKVAIFGLLLALFVLCNRSRPTENTLSLALFSLVFGLVHGAGFSGGLQNIEFLQNNLLIALFGFNVGVELGQLLVVLIVLTLLALIRWVQPRVVSTEAALVSAAALFGLGLYWFAERLWSNSVLFT